MPVSGNYSASLSPLNISLSNLNLRELHNERQSRRQSIGTSSCGIDLNQAGGGINGVIQATSDIDLAAENSRLNLAQYQQRHHQQYLQRVAVETNTITHQNHQQEKQEQVHHQRRGKLRSYTALINNDDDENECNFKTQEYEEPMNRQFKRMKTTNDISRDDRINNYNMEHRQTDLPVLKRFRQDFGGGENNNMDEDEDDNDTDCNDDGVNTSIFEFTQEHNFDRRISSSSSSSSSSSNNYNNNNNNNNNSSSSNSAFGNHLHHPYTFFASSSPSRTHQPPVTISSPMSFSLDD